MYIEKKILGPWARFEDEVEVSRPDSELAKELEEIVRKRQKNSRAGRKAAQQQEFIADESSTLHCMIFFQCENCVWKVVLHLKKTSS